MIKLPETKRTLYHVLKKVVAGESRRLGIYTLMGLKGVGKTTLMKQLCLDCRGVYLNAQVSKHSRDDLFNKLNYVFHLPYSFVCIDNLLELPYEIHSFLKIIEDYADNKTIIIAGDTSVLLHSVMKNLDIIDNYLMIPVDYYEYCTWFDKKVDASSYYEYIRFKRTRGMIDAKVHLQSAYEAVKDKSQNYDVEVEEIIVEAGRILRDSNLTKYLRDSNLTEYLRDKAQCVNYGELLPFERGCLEIFLLLSGFAFQCTQYLTKAVKYSSIDGKSELVGSYQYLHYLYSGFYDSMTFDAECTLDCFNLCCYCFGVDGHIIDELGHIIDYAKSNLAVKVVSEQDCDDLYQDLPYYLSMVETIGIENLIFATLEPTKLEISRRGSAKVLKIPLHTLMYTLGEITLDGVYVYSDDDTLYSIYQKALKLEEEDSKRWKATPQ